MFGIARAPVSHSARTFLSRGDGGSLVRTSANTGPTRTARHKNIYHHGRISVHLIIARQSSCRLSAGVFRTGTQLTEYTSKADFQSAFFRQFRSLGPYCSFSREAGIMDGRFVRMAHWSCPWIFAILNANSPHSLSRRPLTGPEAAGPSSRFTVGRERAWSTRTCHAARSRMTGEDRSRADAGNDLPVKICS